MVGVVEGVRTSYQRIAPWFEGGVSALTVWFNMIDSVPPLFRYAARHMNSPMIASNLSPDPDGGGCGTLTREKPHRFVVKDEVRMLVGPVTVTPGVAPHVVASLKKWIIGAALPS